jgi:signal transduction histidine kinase
MASLFQPFAAHGRKRRGVSSAGLGLTICRRLVREMGGELAVESTVGVGTRFHFALSAPRADDECAAGEWHHGEATGPEAHRPGP